jgi:hypothetical protein
MTDPIETGPEAAAYIKSVIRDGVVIRTDEPNWNPSTSAQLRETQAALAASQADLTAMERERDEAREDAASVRRSLDHANGHREAFLRQRDEAIAELASARTELEQLRREVRILGWQLAAVVEFASAYQPNAERGWAVAIVHDKPCATCKQDITCGQAYARLPGAKGSVHVVCPPPEDPPSAPVPGHHEGATEQ